MLNSLELTGRASTHVRESEPLGATLHPQAARALTDLKAAARGAGIELEVQSGYRDLGRQVAIWNAKYRGSRALVARDGSELDSSSLSERELIDAILAVPALAALTPELLAEAVGSSSMDGRELVLARLPELYERYVLAVDTPE